MHADLVGLGAALLLAGLVARGARRVGLPSVPCYMLVGILLGPGTPGPVLIENPDDLALLASLGLVLLLFHLGVEFPLDQVVGGGRRLFLAAACYIGLNITAGLLFGFALGWGAAEALVVAGALGISSSAIATKLLIELRRLANAETPVILGIIVIEDLFLAFYLALLSPVLSDSDTAGELVRDIAVSFGFLVLLFAVARWGARAVGALVGSREDELLVVVTIGLVVLVAGLAEDVGVSDAIGALMIGLVISRTRFRERVEKMVLPLRDVLATVFFVAFGLTIDVGDLGGVAVPAVIAVCLTVLTNVSAGIVGARLFGFNQRGAANIGLTVLARGEFSLILATLAIAAGLDARIGPFVALYVLLLAVIAPLLASGSRFLARVMPDRLLRSNWSYVREETISTSCTHLDQIKVTDTEAQACEACRVLGDDWVQLRLCTSCGHVGCCDDSPHQHSRRHAAEARHPVIQSAEPGEDWRFCFVDDTLVRAPMGSARRAKGSGSASGPGPGPGSG
ncbi:cation:proton antiporter domain-containing protein [Streptomyces otsuchiensis]|uniref:cation:proton antiporter domain-containing protein n=1 Tax=Streptomyces otsuchiensis TaxID=2681388 RepID=UPI0015836BE1|nr:cation:proton antiporter [Streptomyces otsuchiensis]